MRKSGKTGLRSNAQLFRSIFDNAQIGISFFSVEGREAFTNLAFQQMLGYSEEGLSHLENWDKIVHPDDRASSAKRYAELQQGKRDITERQIRRLHLSSGAMPHLPSIQDERKLQGECSSCRTGKYPCGHL